MKKRTRRTKKQDWPWWKVLPLALFVFGIFGALLALYPDYSPIATVVAALMALAAVIVILRTARRKDWWGQIVYINLWFLFFLGIAVRAWADILPPAWMWLLILLPLYVIAWALPVLHPKLSAYLLKEQMAPETRLGRGCLTAAIALMPIAGGLGAVLGMYGSRLGQIKFVSLAGAIMATLLAIGLSQAYSQQMYPHRPWAKKEEEAPEEK